MKTVKDIKKRIAELEERLAAEQKITHDDPTTVNARVSENCKLMYVFAITELEKILE